MNNISGIIVNAICSDLIDLLLGTESKRSKDKLILKIS